MIRWDRTKGRPEPIRFLNKILEFENGEPLVDVRVACPSIKIIRPQVIPYVREQVAVMCEAAALSLPEGYFLGLVEGWRPIGRQQRIYDFVWKCAIEAFPHRDHAALRRTVCRWVAPTDQKAPPGHCTGAAVDVWLVDENGEEIDVSSPFDRFKSAPTYSLELSENATRNRMILVDAMLGAGFSNCRDEWWHYSYGDAGYAVRMGLKECSYGLIELDPELYAEQEALWIEAVKTRQSPFGPSSSGPSEEPLKSSPDPGE
jgi:D-alanyl-D-alanine dipeptidase